MGASRIIELEGAAPELRFRDAARNYLSLKCPAALGGNVTLELPSADGAAGQVLKTNGAGVLSFGIGGGDITGAGTAGRVPKFSAAKVIADGLLRDNGTSMGLGVAAGANAYLSMVDDAALASALRIDGSNAKPLVNLQQAGNAAGLVINKTAVGAGECLDITNAGTGDALEVNQNAAGIGIDLNVGAAGLNALDIANAGANYGILLTQTGNQTAFELSNQGNDVALHIDSQAGSDNALDIDYNGAGNAIEIDLDAGNYALYIDHNANNTNMAYMISQGTGFPGVKILKGAAATGVTLYVENENAANASDVLQVLNAGGGKHIDTDAGAGTPAHLTNAGVWTDAACYKRLKADFEDVDGAAILASLKGWTIQKHRSQHHYNPNSPKALRVFADDLEAAGIETKGISGVEVASVALVAIQEVLKRVEELERKIA